MTDIDEHPMGITPAQSLMARAALNLSLREVAAAIGKSHTAVHRFESGDDRMGPNVYLPLEDFYRQRRVFFGPAGSVSIGRDIYKAERFFTIALWQLLNEAGVFPSSRDLTEAHARSRERVRETTPTDEEMKP